MEQGRICDSNNWKEGDEEEDEEDGKENDNNAESVLTRSKCRWF